MNGVLGMASLLSDTKIDSEQKQMLDVINSCRDGLITILNDILDYSKIEAGKLDLEAINFDIKKSIDEVLYLSSSLSSKKGIDLSLELKDSVDSFFIGDITRIKQILGNLVSNAIKFTEHGSVIIMVESKSIGDDLAEVVFKVIDTGIGIAPENINALFSAFTQADSSITRKYGGTGLGLSISSKLAVVLGGELSCTSIEGQGSTFILKIPLKVSENIVKSNDSKPKLNTKDLKAHKILLVEDNSMNQNLFVLTLKKLGYTCDIACNGVEALGSLKAQQTKKDKPYSLIFMDMQMPIMGGIEATQEIVKIYGMCRPKIVAMTANVFKEDQDECSSAGMDDFLPKPFKRADLLRILQKF